MISSVTGDVGVNSIADWGLFLTPQALKLLLPGVLIGFSMYLLLRRIRSPYVLPLCMAAVLLGFYSLLLLTGTSLQQAREAGWVAHLSPLGVNYEIYYSYVACRRSPTNS